MYRFTTFLLLGSYCSCSCKDMTETRVLYCNFCLSCCCLDGYVLRNTPTSVKTEYVECHQCQLKVPNWCGYKLIGVQFYSGWWNTFIFIHCSIVFTCFSFTATAYLILLLLKLCFYAQHSSCSFNILLLKTTDEFWLSAFCSSGMRIPYSDCKWKNCKWPGAGFNYQYKLNLKA